MLEISCAKARAGLTSPPELLTAGMAKVVTVHFAFSPDWDGLRKTAVFSDGWRTVDVLESAWADGCTPIPHEVLQTAGRNVRVGVYGSDSTGVALPTVWAELGRVRPAADPSGDTSTDPTAPVWSQLQGQIGDLKKLKTYSKDSLVAAVNELWHSGGGGGGSAVLYTAQELTAAQQKQARENIDVAGYNVINYLWPTEHSGREDTDITTLLDSDVYMGIVKNSTSFPSPGLVMLQGPMPGNVYTAVLLAKDGLTYTATFQYVRSTKHFTVLTPVAAASSKLISVKLTPSESDENVYTADRNIIEIEEALQAGHMALAYTPDAAGLQNSVGLITSCISNFVTVLDCLNSSLGSTRWQVGADGITWTKTFYVEYAPSGWVAELESAMPYPVGKTDAMTQAVGMDETGKLWTQPISGSAETWELIAEIVIPEGADESTALAISKDSDGNPFSLVKARLCAKFPKYTGATTIPKVSFAMLNGKTTGRVTPLAYTYVWPKVSASTITGMVYEIDVSGAQQIEHVIKSGNSGWSDDSSHDYVVYGASSQTDTTWFADTLWAKPITSIGGTGMLIYPGCRFVLYGVRA